MTTSTTFGEKGRTKVVRLFDLNDNNEYGNFVTGASRLPLCNTFLGDKMCASEGEWEAFVKGYTEDAD